MGRCQVTRVAGESRHRGRQGDGPRWWRRGHDRRPRAGHAGLRRRGLRARGRSPAARRAASMRSAGTGGRRALPGEHGFRFFPGFYKHVPDTMSRIPYRTSRTGCSTTSSSRRESQIARAEGAANWWPRRTSRTTRAIGRRSLRFALSRLHRTRASRSRTRSTSSSLLSDLMSACDERRFGEFENQSWWEFTGADDRSPAFRKFLADGLDPYAGRGPGARDERAHGRLHPAAAPAGPVPREAARSTAC